MKNTLLAYALKGCLFYLVMPLPAQRPLRWRPLPSLLGASSGNWAYDRARGRVVMLAGLTTPLFKGKRLGETWEWNGSSWDFRDSNTRPSVRSSHAMAFDPVGRRILVFGGFDSTPQSPNFPLLNETWAWDRKD